MKKKIVKSRNIQLAISLTQKEKTEIVKWAEVTHVSASTFGRQAIFALIKDLKESNWVESSKDKK